MTSAAGPSRPRVSEPDRTRLAADHWNPIQIFDAAATKHPDRPFLIFGSETWTYESAQRRTIDIAERVVAAGFEPGQHGAVLAPNSAQAFLCALGLMRAGLVWLPLNPRNSSTENARLLRYLDCALLFVHTDLAGLVDELHEAGSIEVVPIGGLDHWHRERRGVVLPTLEDDLDAVVAISATSGTTGQPKGVMLSNRNFGAFTAAYRRHQQSVDPPIYLAAAPLTHVAGRICFPIIDEGGSVVILQRPDPESVLAAIETHRVTEVFLPPTAIYALLDHPELDQRDLSSLRRLAYGSAPMRVDRLKEALTVFGPVLSQGYGQTEAPLAIASLRPEDHFVDGRIAPDSRLASCGRPTDAVDLAILDPDGRAVPQGEPGEVCIRGDIVTAGYYRDPEATAEVSRHGWHHTGDIGYLDDEGFLHLVDRAKDMIISGGFNVYSVEVETVLQMHPDVEDVAVIGVPDDHWGEVVVGVVVVSEDAASDAEIIAFARERLGGVKAPKRLVRRADLPRSAAGKPLKRQLRAEFWANQTRQI